MALTRTQKVRLGIFVSTAAAIFLVAVAILGGSRLVEKRDHYWIALTASVTGLEPGSAVKYRGVQVGRVERIRVDPENVGRVIVDISVERGTPIKTDTKAVVETLGITGLKYIDLVKSSQDAPPLPPGGEIAEEPSLMTDLSGRATAIALKTENLLENLVNLTGGSQGKRIEEIITRIDRIMGEIETLVVETRPVVTEVARGLADTSQAAEATLRSVERLVEENRAALHKIVAGIDRVTADLPKQQAALTELLENATETMGAARELLGNERLKGAIEDTARLLHRLNLTVARGQENLDATLLQLNQTTENLRDFSRFLLENPSALFRNIEQEEREFQ